MSEVSYAVFIEKCSVVVKTSMKMEIGNWRGIKGDGYLKRIDPEGHRVTSNSRADQRGLIKNYVVKRVSSLKMFPKVMLRVSLLAYISKYSPSFKTSISFLISPRNSKSLRSEREYVFEWTSTSHNHPSSSGRIL